MLIMYVHRALINALNAHMIHINLNTIFYTHVEHSSTKTIYIKYSMGNTHTHTHTRAHSHTHTHTLARARAHTQTDTHKHSHTHTNTHTHTHTHTRMYDTALYVVHVYTRGNVVAYLFSCISQLRCKAVEVLVTQLFPPVRYPASCVGWHGIKLV